MLFSYLICLSNLLFSYLICLLGNSLNSNFQKLRNRGTVTLGNFHEVPEPKSVKDLRSVRAQNFHRVLEPESIKDLI